MENFEIREFKAIPQVEKVLTSSELAGYIDKYSQPLVARYVRQHIEGLRELIKAGQSADFRKFMKNIIADLDNLRLLLTSRVINGTGIVVHTNLGRTPLGAPIFDRLKEKISGYSSLEFDLLSGERGSRGKFLFELLTALTGAEAGLAVNNNASAVMLILNTFGLGKKCVVSRGEQVQIGGGFRMHEVCIRSGVQLSEVGATNRTVLEDYREAIDDQTSILFKVHLSNFKLVGFTEEVSIRELVDLGREKNLTVVHDLGSGAFVDTAQYGLTHEPTIHDSLSAGADLVCFSGDKLFGGPQAGIILGKKDKIEAVKKNPLYRTVRLDKIIIAILEELAISYMKSAYHEIPLLNILAQSCDDLKKRAQTMQNALKTDQIESEVIETEAYCGGGSLPEEAFESVGLRLAGDYSPQKLARSLRLHDPSIVGRIHEDKLILDLRTIDSGDDKLIISALNKALK